MFQASSIVRSVVSGVVLALVAAPVAALTLEGDARQGGLLVGQLAEGERVQWRGKELMLDTSQRFILGLDRDAPEQITLTITAADGQRREQIIAVDRREYQLQYIEGVKHKYVAPDPRQVERSMRETRQVVQARARLREQSDFLEGFIWPATGPITGVFGSQRVYNGEPRRPHFGVDVAGPVGTPVVAPASGLVTMAEPDLFFSGGTLIIDHGHGLSSSFLHLSKLLVEPGQQVEQGQAVAEIGATGRVTGPHLDWRMNWTGGGKNIRIDPAMLVGPMPGSEQTPGSTEE